MLYWPYKEGIHMCDKIYTVDELESAFTVSQIGELSKKYQKKLKIFYKENLF